MSRALYVAAASSWLPERMTLDEAERAGLADRSRVWNTGIESVCVSAEKSAPDMAVLAARSALDRAGTAPEDLHLLLHACAYHQGHDMWPPASYIQRFCGGGACPAIEVRQMSNGGMAALELAAGYLVADDRPAALITTADRYCPPGFDRWHSDPSTVCGDGATAVVLSTRGGFATLRGLATVSDPGLERGSHGDLFSDAPMAAGSPIDLGLNSDALVRELGLEALLHRIEAGQREAFGRACDQADVKLGDVDWYVLPNLGRTRMRAQYFDPFGIDPQRSTWSWGRRVGHLGPGDQFGGLAHLASEGALEHGQICALASVGAGFTWTVAILEIVGRP
ncbi:MULTISPECIES: ketoacyl-ACP synthase III family protein [Actinomadura]|uniref:3-oxoacyl-ACP synthase n=1 Tax=Actinomadura litoris TaxID=2678616 RepID=A0A7K1L0P3_9ACTN|nr:MULTISPECIES: ketoacyl-ACP synthase III family protein [Actinomadura]MBT2206898.1 ketoacyl-ACP synthase III family protein [Actinomadura sp. NEAU-AAG7]MUN38001.1 3-oxoacyl-ACP synthase [Actinomadura litoris]